jgi:hypothetical protein
MLDSMTSTLFYTFSTIAQTLAGAMALLAAFLLYRLQSLNSEIESNASRIEGSLSGIHGYHTRELLYGEQYVALLELAAKTDFPANHFQADAERARLPALLARHQTLLRSFRVALYLTAGLITMSVLALIATPYIEQSRCLVVGSLGLGAVWFVACMISYVVVLRNALAKPVA